jgi:hypothetical protein
MNRIFLRISMASIVALSAIAATACSAETATESDATQDELGSANSKALKQKLLAIAEANTSNTVDLAATRKSLNPLIAQLAGIYGSPPAATEKRVFGVWKQIWSDDFRPSPPGAPAADLTRIYQVVTPNGYFFNFGESKTPGGAFGTALRGKYASNGRGLDIEFTRLAALSGALPADSGIGMLATKIENGAEQVKDFPPRPPIGVQGKLQNLYLDSELRIVQGGTIQQQYNQIYILKRVK